MSRYTVRSAFAVVVAAVLAFSGLSSAHATTAVTLVNLALGAEVTASSTHPHDNYALHGANLVDGSTSTRWAAADDAAFPLTIDLDFGEELDFDQVSINEYTDSGTDFRVANYELQRWDAAAEAWVTFVTGSDGIGDEKSITGFGTITSSKLRVSITDMLAGEVYTPTLTEVRVYSSEVIEEGAGESDADEATPPADDDAYFGYQSVPAGAVQAASDAEVVLVPGISSSGNSTFRTVASDGSVVLQEVDETSGAVTETFELSGYIDEVSSAAASLDYDSASPYPLVVYLIGERSGEPVLLRVITPGASTLGTTETTTVESLDAADFEERSGIPLADLELLSPFSTGLAAIYSDGSGYAGKRVSYTLAPQEGGDPFALPFTGEDRTFHLDDYANLYSGRDGGVDMVSLYDPSSVTSATVDGLGTATSWLVSEISVLLVADAEGRVASFDLQNSMSVRALITLDEPAASLAYASYLSEIQVASAAGDLIRRYSVDGVERTAIEAPGGVLAGSLRSYIGYAPATTYLAAIDESVYAYRTFYVSSPKLWFTPSLSAAERGSGVDFAMSAAGTGISPNDMWFEYSLDGGETWAKRGEDWSSAVSDRGNVTIAPTVPSEPLDGIAPYLLQETGEDVWANNTVSRWESSVTISAAQYDALWRYRGENAYGSFASGTTTIVIESEQEADTSLRVTTQPVAVRITAGQGAVFSAAAEAGETPAVQWQRSADGETWEDIDGATSTELQLVAAEEDNGSSYRAVFASGDSEVTTDAAVLSVMVPEGIAIGAAPEGAVVVAGASVNLDLSAYSQEWSRDTAGENVSLGETGFVFDGGTGWTDAATGETQLTWEGTAIYLPYGGGWGLYQAYANPYLSVAADGRATLTAELAWNDGGGVWSGEVESSYKRVIVQTYASSELTTNDDGATSFSGTPEWTGRAYAEGAGAIYPDSFPASLLDYLSSDNRGWFYASGSTRDPEKAPLPVTATFTASTEIASTSGATVDPADPLGDGVNPFTPTTPSVASQPQATTIALGSSTVLSATASGSPVPSVQWQQLIDGTWTDIAGATGTEYEVGGLAEGEYSFRAVFTGDGVSVESDAAVVTVSTEAVEEEPVSTGELMVTPDSELQDGATVSVSGSGFAQGANANGVYLLFGYVEEFPSEGAGAGDGYDYIPGEENQRFIAWPGSMTAGAAQAVFEDGAFSIDDLTARSSFVGASGELVDCLAADLTCGVFTIGAHGVADAGLETFTPVSFAADEGADSGSDEGADSGDGTDSGVDDGTDSGSDGDDSGATAADPSESDLLDELEGGITAPISAVTGSTVTVVVGAERAGETVSAFLFSDPLDLGIHTVSATGTIEVQLPEDVTGQHRLAVYDAQGQLIGWASISISVVAAEAEELMRTGGELPAGELAASLLLLMAGAVLVIVARRRRLANA